jgi:hypothetical protein
MAYSCSDAFDDILFTLEIDTGSDDLWTQTDLMIREIGRLRRFEKAVRKIIRDEQSAEA